MLVNADQLSERSAGSGLTPPLPAIEREYRIEVFRKAIHLCSLAIPIIYFYIPRTLALRILVPITLAFLFIDIARYYSRPIERWFYHFFGWLLRKRESNPEKKTLNGATYVLIAATVSVFIFPKIIAITAFIILIISDLSSALVGRRFGKHRFFLKSLEGSGAFFITAALVVFVTPKIEYASGEYLVGIAAAFLGAIVEALPWEFDDNLTVPLCVGAALWLGYTIFLPGIDMYRFG